MNITKETFLAGFFGLAVGDALGVPVEFKSRDSLKKKPVEQMLEYGTHAQPAGTWSDDSSLTFCLTESLVNGYNLEDIANEFVKWVMKSKWTPHGKVFDIGGTTYQSINRLVNGESPLHSGANSEYDNGNGSLMRVLPLIYFLANTEDFSYKHKIISEVSGITHAHPRSILACSIYVEFGIQLLKGLNLSDSLKNMQKTITSFYNFHPFSSEIKNYYLLLNQDISLLDEEDIGSSGYVVDTLEASFWCLFKNKTFKDTVLSAVNLGEDTDTTGAVTGSLAGIYYGIQAIPKEWTSRLARLNDIESLILNFYKFTEKSAN